MVGKLDGVITPNDYIANGHDGSSMADYGLELTCASVNSEQSRRNLRIHVNQFVRFTGFKTSQQLLETDHTELRDRLIAYVLDLSKRVSPNTVPTYMMSIKIFLETNDIELPWKKIKRFYPRRRKLTGQGTWTTEQIRKMLDLAPKYRNKAIIHFLASTGVRAGSIEAITVGNLRDMPHGCKMVTIYEDDIEEYKTFLTPEASNAVETYLKERRDKGETITESSPLFINRDGTRAGYSSVNMIVSRLLKKGKLRTQKRHGRFDQQICHGFRKRFNTILKLNNEVNDNAIEKMLGHRNGLDGTYLQIPDERLFEEFYKGITDLTISDEYRDKVIIEELREQVPESYKDEMRELKNQMKEMSKLISDLTNPNREELIQQEWIDNSRITRD
ncbi:MAG: site-specific integrase [Thaumarchaeota archaeon]|nr:site-specific integrase [Nitrososphaerota archaeon]